MSIVPMADELQPAYVLHRRPYTDSSLLLELLTPRAGRVAVMARGARRGRSRRAGVLQAFVPLLAAWRGRGEVMTLTQVEAAARPHALGGERAYCGFYLNELLMALTQRWDPHPELFALYATALEALASSADADNVLRRFEVGMLRELGYGLVLTHERNQGPAVAADRRYRYVPAEGPVAATTTDRDTVSGDTLLHLAQGGTLAGDAVVEARQLLRAVLSHYLEGREIRSRELFRTGPGHP